MRSRIHIHRLCIHACHGVLPQENTVGANFYVSLVAEVEVGSEAYQHDQLDGTVSYADICDVIGREMRVTSRTLEHVVWRVGNALMHEFPAIRNVTLRIDKENPPMGVQADSVGVEMIFGMD